MSVQPYQKTYNVQLHHYEVEALIRLLGHHVAGPDNGPRGILTGRHVLGQLQEVSGIDANYTKPLNITKTSVNMGHKLVVQVEEDE
jgi:hypothetical protein